MKAPYVSKFYDNTLSCYSYSKSLSLPGERIGYVAANPRCTDAELISAICGQISRGTGHNCPPSIIQLAVAEVLDQTSDMSVYETNMNLLYNELISLGFECVRPGGTFYIIPYLIICHRPFHNIIVMLFSSSAIYNSKFLISYNSSEITIALITLEQHTTI